MLVDFASLGSLDLPRVLPAIMSELPWLFITRFVVCFAAGCVATRIDLRERRIPNWLTMSLLAAGILLRGATEWGEGLLSAAGGIGVGFGIFFVLWLAGGGAGDVKFMAAVGAWLGPYHTFMVIVLSAIWLLICMVGLLFWRVVAPLFAPQPAAAGVSTEDGSPKFSPANLLTQVVPYALPATLAIGLRLAWMLLLGRTS